MSKLERTFEITNRLGLHARAAAQLVQIANRFQSECTITKDGVTVNGKSIMGVLTLAAAMGSQIVVAVEGADAEAAMAEVAALIQGKFGES
jgi:phosphocarrier protein